jgi:dimethylglycine dehydrogenase
MGYVDAAHAAPGSELEVEILGEMYKARVLDGPSYDANGANMRG